MKNQNKIKILIKKICDGDAVFVDHDLNVTITKLDLKMELWRLIHMLEFSEMNRVIGYFIDELEGDGINLKKDKMDNAQTYFKFCLDECGISRKDLIDYVYTFKNNNL